MIETALVFDKEGKTIHWHLPPGRSSGAIPDTRDLWEILWANRHNLGGVAHTHPWDGIATPSQTDITTFKAIELGLGIQLFWPIITFNHVAVYIWRDQFSTYKATHSRWIGSDLIPTLEIEKLRELSR